MENLLYFFRKPAKYQNDDNFCKIHANDFILGHKDTVIKDAPDRDICKFPFFYFWG